MRRIGLSSDRAIALRAEPFRLGASRFCPLRGDMPEPPADGLNIVVARLLAHCDAQGIKADGGAELVEVSARKQALS